MLALRPASWQHLIGRWPLLPTSFATSHHNRLCAFARVGRGAIREKVKVSTCSVDLDSFLIISLCCINRIPEESQVAVFVLQIRHAGLTARRQTSANSWAATSGWPGKMGQERARVWALEKTWVRDGTVNLGNPASISTHAGQRYKTGSGLSWAALCR
jgi:hypothetical protein